jgi:hypothetical protein
VLRGHPSVVLETQRKTVNAAIGTAIAGTERTVRRTLQRRRTQPIKKRARPATGGNRSDK